MPPAFESVTTYPHAVWMWMKELGKPLALGIALLASTLAATGYCLVRLAWRWHVVAAWRRRARKRASAA